MGSFVKSNATATTTTATTAISNGTSTREVNSTDNGAILSGSSSSSSVTVLSGQVLSGVVSLGDSLLVGPLGAEGAFVPVTVASLRVNNVAVKKALAGQLTTLVVDEQSPPTRTAQSSATSTPSGTGTGADGLMAAEMTRTGSLNSMGCKSPRSTSSLSSYAPAAANSCSNSNNLTTTLPDNNTGVAVGVSGSSRSGSPDTETKDDTVETTAVTVVNNSSNSSKDKGGSDSIMISPSSSLHQQLSQYQLGLPGQVLLSPSMHGARPVAYWEFDAEFLCLFHPGKVSIVA